MCHISRKYALILSFGSAFNRKRRNHSQLSYERGGGQSGSCLSLSLTTGDQSQSSNLTARLTCSSDLRCRRSVPFWVDGSDGDFVPAVGLQGLQNQAVLTAGHRPLQGKHGRHLEIPSSKVFKLDSNFLPTITQSLVHTGNKSSPTFAFYL